MLCSVVFSRRRRHTRCALVTGVQTCALPIYGSCHCGAVRLTLPAAPDKATSCNCSLCRRSGGIWAYYEFGTVSVQGHPGNTEDYIWGDRTLRNVRCKTCGIVTHWEPLEPRPGARQGVDRKSTRLNSS